MHVLETYTVWALERENYANVGFTAILRAANDRAYSSRQHFAVLALFRATSHLSQFCVAVCDAYYQRLPHEYHARITGYALSNIYLKARESAAQ